MRRNMSKVISVALTMSLALTVCACSAKSSVDTENTTAEAETEIEAGTGEETEEETVNASGNDVSDNDVSENDAEDITEEETLTESEEEESTEEETEEEAVTPSKTSEKDSTKSETTTSETTTEAVTVQSVSAVVSGTHYVGETLTGADFTVTVTYSDGETLTNPAGWSAQPLTLNSTSNLITVAYEGASVTITVPASVQETTAATVASNTTTTTTTKAETTQAATTQATTAATTAATTQAETTTAATTIAAETTTAATNTNSNTDTVYFEDGTWTYPYAVALFNAQNEIRAEAGLDPYIWDDSLYEAAKQCAKVCGDAGVTNHNLTSQYRYVLRTTSDGRTLSVSYAENLQTDGFMAYLGEEPALYMDYARSCLSRIMKSDGHNGWVVSSEIKYSAVAVYRKGDKMYISYLFYEGDEVYNQGEYYDPETDQWYYP